MFGSTMSVVYCPRHPHRMNASQCALSLFFSFINVSPYAYILQLMSMFLLFLLLWFVCRDLPQQIPHRVLCFSRKKIPTWPPVCVSAYALLTGDRSGHVTARRTYCWSGFAASRLCFRFWRWFQRLDNAHGAATHRYRLGAATHNFIRLSQNRSSVPVRLTFVKRWTNLSCSCGPVMSS